MTDNVWYSKYSQRIVHDECKKHFNGNLTQDVEAINDEFALECLRSHNHFRALHACHPLHLSIEVSRFSQQWADHIAKEDHLFHSHHPRYGENLFVTYLSNNSLPMTRGSEVVETWYSENKFYPFNGHVTRETVSKAGHFTQVVWSNSRDLGIGKSVSKSNRVYVVANYYPPGNIMNKFPAHVPKKIEDSLGKHFYSNRLFTKSVGFRRRIYFDSWIES